MRLWTLSPKYLDAKGLVALWRESLLAKNVLAGNTSGYRNHPQLLRFKALEVPLVAIDQYLEHVYAEALNREYVFDPSKFQKHADEIIIPVTSGQVEYELGHLQKKLTVRDPGRLTSLPASLNDTEVLSIFSVVPGGVEEWEIIN